MSDQSYSRQQRLRDLEQRALKRVKRRQVSIIVAERFDRTQRVFYWRMLTAEAQQLADRLWLARTNPRLAL